jgi:hypothetical protein
MLRLADNKDPLVADAHAHGLTVAAVCRGGDQLAITAGITKEAAMQLHLRVRADMKV